jgi:hypothetical protein
MSGDRIESYLLGLKRELRLRWVPSKRLLEETRGHLADAVNAAERRGLLRDEAEQEALARFGDTRTVAARFAAEQYRRLEWLMLAPALLTGISIATIDARPHWDDTGITVGMLLIGSALLGLGVTRRAWMIALAVGIWIPVWMAVNQFMGNGAPAGSVNPVPVGCVVLAVSMAGAYMGMGVRRIATHAGQRV